MEDLSRSAEWIELPPVGDLPPAPNSFELWRRLQRFDRTCLIAFHRTSPQAGGCRHSTVWRVCIHHLQAKVYDYVDEKGPTLTEPLTRAVERAEAKRLFCEGLDDQGVGLTEAMGKAGAGIP